MSDYKNSIKRTIVFINKITFGLSLFFLIIFSGVGYIVTLNDVGDFLIIIILIYLALLFPIFLVFALDKKVKYELSPKVNLIKKICFIGIWAFLLGCCFFAFISSGIEGLWEIMQNFSTKNPNSAFISQVILDIVPIEYFWSVYVIFFIFLFFLICLFIKGSYRYMKNF